MPSKFTHPTLKREQREDIMFPLQVGNQKLTDTIRFSKGCRELVTGHSFHPGSGARVSRRPWCPGLQYHGSQAIREAQALWVLHVPLTASSQHSLERASAYTSLETEEWYFSCMWVLSLRAFGVYEFSETLCEGVCRNFLLTRRSTAFFPLDSERTHGIKRKSHCYRGLTIHSLALCFRNPQRFGGRRGKSPLHHYMPRNLSVGWQRREDTDSRSKMRWQQRQKRQLISNSGQSRMRGVARGQAA